nr:putative transposase, mutator type, MULE transposase domain protein [Tanacetum cinerariifolium]
VNYAGCFTESPGRRYVNGEFAYFDCIDIDEFSFHELNDMVKKIGFSGKNVMYYSFLKPNMSLGNGLYALINDEDARRMAEYIRLGYKMIDVLIEHDKTTVFTYIDDAYNTPKHKCLIMKIPEGVSPINASLVNKMKPIRPVLGICAKKLLLGWKQNDANVIGESRSRLEDGGSSQPNIVNPTTQTDFVNDFYSASNPYLEVEDFDPFFRLDSEPVDATIARNECVGKGKGVALDDDQIHVEANKTIKNETADGNSYGDTSESSEHDEFSASDEDGIERIRSRKMKQLKKHNSFKEGGLQKNDKVRVRAACRGTIHVFNTSCDIGPSNVVESSQTQRDIPVKTIQEQLQRKFQLEVSRMKTFRAKEKAVNNVRGDFTLQYTQLTDYVMELQQSNPNTTVRIGVESKADNVKPTRIFKRIYVCLGVAKEGFKDCMRQFLGFDGTFMKGPFPSQMLTAVGVDPNNGIYHLAYGIVEVESIESWIWFLQHLKEDLDLQDNSNFTFISDRQKRDKIDILLNNLCEVFNGQLVDGRDRPVISIIEYASEYLMKRIVNVKQVIERSDGPLTPTATRLFNVINAEASQCIANFNRGSLYGVTCNEVGRPPKIIKKSAGEDI